MSVFKKKAENAKHAAKLSVDVSTAAIGELGALIKDKLARIQKIIQSTLQALNYYKSINIISNSDIIVCTSTLIECFEKTNSMLNLVAHNT
jgi:transcription antitermination factor NusA-like protein